MARWQLLIPCESRATQATVVWTAMIGEHVQTEMGTELPYLYENLPICFRIVCQARRPAWLVQRLLTSTGRGSRAGNVLRGWRCVSIATLIDIRG